MAMFKFLPNTNLEYNVLILYLFEQVASKVYALLSNLQIMVSRLFRI